MLTSLLLIGAVVVQCLAESSTSDLQTAETKWKGGHYGPGYGGYGPGPGLGYRSPYGPWGGPWGARPGIGRFADYYGPGFYGDPLAAFSLGMFPGGVDPWGLGYRGFGPWIY